MSNGRENIDLDTWRRSVSGLGQDEGYAERFEEHARGQKAGFLRTFLMALFGLVLIVALTLALLTGWFREALWGLMILAGCGVALKILNNAKARNRQERAFNEAVERQNGIDKRWGRLGSERKNKNA